MKSLAYLLCFVLLSAFTFENNIAPGDPIPGVGVNLGRKPGGEIVAKGVTDKNGNFEFKDLEEGSYFVEFTTKDSQKPVHIQGIQITKTNAGTENRQAAAEPKSVSKITATAQVSATFQSNWVRITVKTPTTTLRF